MGRDIGRGQGDLAAAAGHGVFAAGVGEAGAPSEDVFHVVDQIDEFLIVALGGGQGSVYFMAEAVVLGKDAQCQAE